MLFIDGTGVQFLENILSFSVTHWCKSTFNHVKKTIPITKYIGQKHNLAFHISINLNTMKKIIVLNILLENYWDKNNLHYWQECLLIKFLNKRDIKIFVFASMVKFYFVRNFLNSKNNFISLYNWLKRLINSSFLSTIIFHSLR